MISKKLSVALSALALSAPVLADSINLQFQFNVNSSSHSLYACNAGLNTTKTTGQLYFDSITKASITAAACSANPHNCVTVDAQDQHLKNTLSATFGDWNSGVATTTVMKTSANNSVLGLASAGTLFDINTTSSWASNIKSLNFNFASPTTDAEFFVDICYRGPQVEFFDIYASNLPLKWKVSSGVTTTNLTGRDSYVSDVQLTGQSVLFCDVQGEGAQLHARNASDAYNTLINDISESSIKSNVAADVVNATALTALPASGTQNMLAAKTIENGSAVARAPRFCKVRYYFKETSALRNWNATGSLFTLSTTVQSAN